MLEMLAKLFKKGPPEPKVVVAVPVVPAAPVQFEIGPACAHTARAVLPEEWDDKDELPTATRISLALNSKSNAKVSGNESRARQVAAVSLKEPDNEDDLQPKCCGLFQKKGYQRLPTNEKVKKPNKVFTISLFGKPSCKRSEAERIQAKYAIALANTRR